MKIDWKDMAYTSVVLLLVLAISLIGAVLSYSIIVSALSAFAPLAAVALFMTLFSVALALYLRLLLAVRPLKGGVYLLDDAQFRLWKHCSVLSGFLEMCLFWLNMPATRVFYYQILGAKLGDSVAIGSVRIADPFMTTIGSQAIVGDGAVISSHVLFEGRFVLRRVVIGANATVGAQVVLTPGCHIGDRSMVGILSRVDVQTRIPPGEYWDGIPARKTKDLRDKSARRNRSAPDSCVPSADFAGAPPRKIDDMT